MKARLISLILFLGLAFPAYPVTYYVANAGNDSNAGTSSGAPWRTVAHAQGIVTGDKHDVSLLFNQGDTWREQFSEGASGTSGHPFIIGAYGTGAAPIISAADVLPSWTTESSIYYATVAATANQAFRDGSRLTLAASKGALVTGSWWWDSANMRVYVYDNPSGHTMEASQRQFGVLVQNPYVTVTSIHATKANDSGFSLGADYNTGNGLTADYNFNAGIHGGGVNYTLTSNTISYNGGNGIFFVNSNNFLVSGNTVHHNGQLALTADHDYAGGIRFGLYQIGAGAVEYNLVYAQGQGGLDAGMGINYDTNTGTTVTYIRYNETWGNYGAGIRLDLGVNAVVYGNVVYGNLGGNNSAGIQCAWSSHGNKIYNNTVVSNSGFGISNEGYTAPDSVTNDIFENNISVGNSRANLFAWGGGENDGTKGYGNVYLYNDFGPQASGFIAWGGASFPGTGYSTYATWEAAAGNCGSPGCSHSVQSDPLFVNAGAGQFWLQAGSPAIGAGTPLGSPYDMGLSSSSVWPSAVVTISVHSPPEIGAYVYGSTTTPRAVVNLVATPH